jgi:hypothetical protein
MGDVRVTPLIVCPAFNAAKGLVVVVALVKGVPV